MQVNLKMQPRPNPLGTCGPTCALQQDGLEPQSLQMMGSMLTMMQSLLAMMSQSQTLFGGGGFGGGQPGAMGPGMSDFLGGSAGGASASPATAVATSTGGASAATGDAQTSGNPDWANKLPGPMRNLGPLFEKYGKKYNVDPRFLAAISMLETGNGTSSAFKNKNNAMGVSDAKGPIGFNNVEESIERMARVLASGTGPYKGARIINEIGKIYAPPGAGNDVNGTNGGWGKNVSNFYQQLGGDPNKPVK